LRTSIIAVDRGFLVGLLRAGGKDLAQRRIAAFDDGGGTLHGQCDVAVPVADQAVLPDRLVEHLRRRLCDGVEFEDGEDRGQDGQAKHDGEAERQALADFDVR
jgi:hypothetical protein